MLCSVSQALLHDVLDALHKGAYSCANLSSGIFIKQNQNYNILDSIKDPGAKCSKFVRQPLKSKVHLSPVKVHLSPSKIVETNGILKRQMELQKT